MYYILTILISFLSVYSISQNDQKQKFSNELACGFIVLNFDAGKYNVNTPNSLSKDYDFLMKAHPKTLMVLDIAELQVLYKDKIGVSFGLIDYSMKGSKSEIIYSDIQKHVPDLIITVPKIDYDKGVFSITDQQEVFSLKLGVVGNFNVGKFSFVPSIAAVLPINRTRFGVEADCIDPVNNISFKRKYDFKGSYQSGVKIGIDARFIIVGNIFIGLRVGYSYIKLNNRGTTLDVFEDGSEILSNTINFHQVNSNLYFGVNFGFKFGYGYKKKVSSKS